MPSGVRVRLATDAEELVVGCEPLAEDGCFDLCIGGQIAATASYVAGATEVRFEGLPAGGEIRGDLAVAGHARLPCATLHCPREHIAKKARTLG